ncbi:hypothetical protein D3C79_946720 [compost metagenome]
MVLVVANDIQKPDKAPGPATTFVVVDDINGIGVVPQLTEQCFERRLRRHEPWRGCLAELCAFGVDEARTGNMPFGVADVAGQVHQDQLAGFEAREQVARLDHQRQAREVRHVRSPGHKKGGL